MAYLKRWTSSLVSRLDWMVTQVENHESLVTSSIQDVQKAAARAKVQVLRVRRDGEKLQRRLAEEREAAVLWRDRARRAATDDEARALDCLRRAKRASRAVDELERRAEEHRVAESQLTQDVRTIEERLATLRERRNLMRTRQSRAEALSSVQDAGTPFRRDLEDVFERWETQVTEVELSSGCELELDVLDEHFATAEEEESLREELRALREEGERPPVGREPAAPAGDDGPSPARP